MDQTYLRKYTIDWELSRVILEGQSALDTPFFVAPMASEAEVDHFLKGYGLDPANPVTKAELFGNFQEAIQFIKRYFLKEGNPQGLDLQIPQTFFMITDIHDLFLTATATRAMSLEVPVGSERNREERLWGEVILKVMHTILHIDKDLRSDYFSIIQTQIFDRFYKHIFRTEENLLFLGDPKELGSVQLVDFSAKAKKARDSIIIKLLHKAENVAEELFDRIGLRFITQTPYDCLRVIHYLTENNIVIPHNIKPSRSLNSILNLGQLKDQYQKLIRTALREKWSEEQFVTELNEAIIRPEYPHPNAELRNRLSLKSYRSIQFTGRQLIKYKNPFFKEFSSLRTMAKKEDDSALVQKILSMDISWIARDVRFFYPFEVQIVDQHCHHENTAGDASHLEYKRNQVLYAMKRLFARLCDFKGIEL